MITYHASTHTSKVPLCLYTYTRCEEHPLPRTYCDALIVNGMAKTASTGTANGNCLPGSISITASETEKTAIFETAMTSDVCSSLCWLPASCSVSTGRHGHIGLTGASRHVSASHPMPRAFSLEMVEAMNQYGL